MKVKNFPFAISVDGYGAGENQNIKAPLGSRGLELHQWMSKTATHQKIHYDSDRGTKQVDDRIVAKGFENVGAWILGRNMFSPVRGPWLDESWRGWWGENPPFHTDVFVLTHYPRDPVKMEGGTTFYFVTDGIESALNQAKKSAKEKDVCIGGGVSTLHQYLKARFMDEFQLTITPLLFGSGENLFSNINLVELGYSPSEWAFGEGAMHVLLKKSMERSRKSKSLHLSPFG